MRALLIRSPHIEKILGGNKSWEIRGSRTKIRGRIGLIRSRSGTVVGTCELIDCIGPLSKEELRRNARRAGMKPEEVELPYSRTFAWVISNPQYLKTPVPYRHPSGAVIWVTLAGSTEKTILRSFKNAP